MAFGAAAAGATYVAARAAAAAAGDESAFTAERAAQARWLVDELLRERESGRLVILVTHDLEAAAQVAGHIVVVRRGRLALDKSQPSGFGAAEVRALYAEAVRDQ